MQYTNNEQPENKLRKQFARGMTMYTGNPKVSAENLLELISECFSNCKIQVNNKSQLHFFVYRRHSEGSQKFQSIFVGLISERKEKVLVYRFKKTDTEAVC